MEALSTCSECGARLFGPDAACMACALALGLTEESSDTRPVAVRYLGDYDLIEEIASGAAASVWRGRQRSLGREVAVKVLHGGALAGPVAQARFRLEAEAVARLDHPSIVPIYEVGDHEGSPYFSMRYLAGGSLAQALGRWMRDPRGAATLVAKVARAVHHAHQHGLIHRDIKPGNILLDAGGEPLIADFGLALWSTQDGSLTATAQLLGTPAYMSPEQARGETASVVSDVWALGAVLYELLAGRPPFQGASPVEVLERFRTHEPPPLTGVGRDLATICLKCLEQEPSARYESAKELAADLERWLDGKPVRARPISAIERVAKALHRHPWKAGFFALLPIPFIVSGIYVVVLNWLAKEYEVVPWNTDGTLVLPIEELGGTRCSKNFNRRPLLGRPVRLRLEVLDVPPELAKVIRVRIFGDRPGWPDIERQGPVADGEEFTLLVPTAHKLVSERNLYFQEIGWRAADVLDQAPQAKLRLVRLQP